MKAEVEAIWLSSYAARWIRSAIVRGRPEGGFHPTAPVSRQAMAAFLHRVTEAVGA